MIGTVTVNDRYGSRVSRYGMCCKRSCSSGIGAHISMNKLSNVHNSYKNVKQRSYQQAYNYLGTKTKDRFGAWSNIFADYEPKSVDMKSAKSMYFRKIATD